MIKKYNLDPSLVNYIDNLGMGVEERGALGGTVYYVENNAGNDAWDGLSIDYPFKTLAKAISVSNSDMARRARWAKRNTIYYFADAETVSLAAIPQKTDIVGCGSNSAYKKATIIGAHAPLTEAFGCRFINVRFQPVATGNILWTTIANNNGIEFHNCDFIGSESGATAASAISTTATAALEINKCRFYGAFSGDVIAIGSGDMSGLRITNCTIHGAANDGIVIASGATTSGVEGAPIIDNNIISVAVVTINDGDSSSIITNNRLISLAAKGTLSTVLVYNAALASNNDVTGNDGSVHAPSTSD